MESYDVYMYSGPLEDGGDLAGGFTSLKEAIDHADDAVAGGFYHTATVGVGDDVHEIYHTGHGLLRPLSPDLPAVAPLGPRSRTSGLAERLAEQLVCA